jgi:hypothetical protein
MRGLHQESEFRAWATDAQAVPSHELQYVGHHPVATIGRSRVRQLVLGAMSKQIQLP